MQKVKHYNQRKKWQVTLTEDQALAEGISLHTLVVDKIDEGFEVVYEYTHPAVGRVVVLEPEMPWDNSEPEDPCYE